MKWVAVFLVCACVHFAHGEISHAVAGNGFAFFETVRPPRSIEVIAHPGAMRRAPENSGRAIELAIADMVEWVEVDVRLTKNGHHVLFHDDTVDLKTDGTGRVCELNLAELRALDAGTKFGRRFAGLRILTLKEGLALARGRVNLYLDCKDVKPVALSEEVLAAKMARQVVIYLTRDVLRAVRTAVTEELALMTKWRPGTEMTPWLDQLRPAAVEIDAVDVTPDVCKEFHRRKIKVQAKTLEADDRPEVWDRVTAAGAD